MKALLRLYGHFKLTSKIVTLVVLLGALAVGITLYSTISLHAVDRDYRSLIDRDAQASVLVGAAMLDLSDASRLVFAVLTEQEEARMRAAQHVLDHQQDSFRNKITQIRPLLDHADAQLDKILQQQKRLFELAATIVDSAARWRGDRALNIIYTEFDPTLNGLRAEMDLLRADITSHFEAASTRLNATTRATLRNTALAFGLALATIISLSAWLSVTQISRPINALTRAMSRLSTRDYNYPIAYTERRDEVGRMAQALEVFRDNMQRADRLELEAAASAEARRLSQQLVDLTDAMPGAVFQLLVSKGGEAQFIFLSGKAERFIGEVSVGPTDSGLRLDNVRTHRTAEGDAALAAAIAHSIATLEPLDIDMQVATRERVFWLKTLATARRQEDGAILFNGVWLDISDIKAQSRALEAAKEQAELAAKAKSAFLATMSHEIRTPMNAVIGLTQLALRHPLAPDQQDRVEKILRASRHLLGIINDILDFSKIDSGSLSPEAIVFSPQQILDDVWEMLEGKAADKGLTLNMAPADRLPLLVGDPLRISQILLNYINNAIKFSAAGSVTVRLELEELDGVLHLHGAVRDEGIGLEEGQIQRLFQPFQQADSSITRRFGGTGLGLAISRNLAELLGGSVGVSSAPGRGSTFWFRVRVEPARMDATLPAPPPVEASPEALRGLRLLLVDDNELNRLVASELLKDAGMEVDQAHDGRHAISILEEAPDGTYDGVLMDMMMPELDGLSATRLLRQNPRFLELPIIAMTANASREDVELCLAAGMDAHLAKPIDEHRLWQALARFCRPGGGEAEGRAQTPAPDDARSAPALDLQPLAHFQGRLEPERFAAMILMVRQDCLARAEKIRAQASRSDPDMLIKLAHDLVATAGQSGFRQLEGLGHALRRAIRERDGEAIDRLIENIDAATLQAIKALELSFADAGEAGAPHGADGRD